MKVSKAQLKVLRLMGEGWELLRRRTGEGGCYLSYKGEHRGFKTVNVNTWFRLYKLGLIATKPEMQFPTETWFLTEEGKKVIQ